MIVKPFTPFYGPVGLFRGTPRGVWAALWPGCGPGRLPGPGPGPAAPAGPRPRVPGPPTPQIPTGTGRKTIFSVIVCHYPPDKGGNDTR
jgi:hypothetical protein